MRDGEAILKKFTYLQTQGRTALYDAVYLGIEKVSEGILPKRAIILISERVLSIEFHSRRQNTPYQVKVTPPGGVSRLSVRHRKDYYGAGEIPAHRRGAVR
jgi:hypothetical protein